MDKAIDTQSTSTIEAQPAIPVVQWKAGKFNGSWKNWQSAAFGCMERCGLPKPIAHEVAMDYGSAIGKLVSSEEGKNFVTKVGKLAKKGDGERSISIAGKANVKASDAMSIVYVCQTIEQLFSEKLLSTKTMPKLSENLAEYIVKCEERAALKEWVD
jgi:hypothetical protein